MTNLTTTLPCSGEACGTNAPTKAVTAELVLGLSLAAFVCAVAFTIGMIIFIRRQCRKDDKEVEATIADANRIESGFEIRYQPRMKQPPGLNFAFVSKTNTEVILGRKSTSGDERSQYISRNVNIAAETDDTDDQNVKSDENDIHFVEAEVNSDNAQINEAFENDNCSVKTDKTESEEVIHDIMDLVHSLQSEANSTSTWDDTKMTVL